MRRCLTDGLRVVADHTSAVKRSSAFEVQPCLHMAGGVPYVHSLLIVVVMFVVAVAPAVMAARPAPPPTRLGGLIRPCVSARASNAAPSLLVTSSVSASSKRAAVPRHACLACMSQPATMLVVAATSRSRVSTSRLCAAASPVGCVRRGPGSRWRRRESRCEGLRLD